MESSGRMFFGILVAVVAAAVAILVIFLRATRSRKAASEASSQDPVAAPSAAPPPSAPPPAAPAPRPEAAPAPARSAPEPLQQVLLEFEGMILGAIPPFGTVTFADGVVRYEAHSRIVAATAGGLLGNDGGSTMQSMGSMEIGEFVVEFPLEGAAISDEPDGDGVRLVSAGRSGRLAAVRGDHGRIRDALRSAMGS